MGGQGSARQQHFSDSGIFWWKGSGNFESCFHQKAKKIPVKEIATAEDPEKMRKQKVKEYKDKFANPYVAAAKGYIDSVIEPKETRKILLHAIEVSENKAVYLPKKKHGVPPF